MEIKSKGMNERVKKWIEDYKKDNQAMKRERT